ncbi:transmembrane protein 270 [Ctenodactylus gundi]
MEAAAPLGSGLLEILLQVARLLGLLVQNRTHLYTFLLLKITLFRCWVAGLAQEARGPSYKERPTPLGGATCPLGQALRTGLVLLWVPVWLLLQGPRLVREAVLACASVLQGLGLWEALARSVAAGRDLLLSCLYGLMLLALLSLLLAWKLFQKVRCFSLGWLPCQSRVLWGLLALLSRPHWHLAYLVTWTTCLASRLLQVAFEHTTRLAQAQEAEPGEASLPPASSVLEAGTILQEPGTPGQ